MRVETAQSALGLRMSGTEDGMCSPDLGPSPHILNDNCSQNFLYLPLRVNIPFAL